MSSVEVALPKVLEDAKEAGLQLLYPQKTKVSVGMASCGLATGAGKVFKVLQEGVEKSGSTDIEVCPSGCLGFCQMEPLITVQRPDKPKLVYCNISEDKAEKFLEATLKGEDIPEWILCRMDEEELIVTDSSKVHGADGGGDVPAYGDVPFFSMQKRIVLRNCGFIDSDHIDEYIARGGYAGLVKILDGMSPEEVIEDVKKSGLRGRGGGGFPTGLKWQFCRQSPGDTKYVICNADEGDPGAYMDRSVLECDPHSVLEGMAIGAYAMGAKTGIIYVRSEYPLAVEKLSLAIVAARKYGLLGKDILGKGFDFDIKIVEGAGAFVCGEETSLTASIDGRPAEPRPRPPFPAESGLDGKPTNINNVETWANVPAIIVRGSDWYSAIGTEKSTGTKVFSLVGAVNNTGLVEVPMGTKLSDIVYDVGGGIIDGKRLKAIQTGGPSGGCIPVNMVDMPVDYEKLAEVGSIMGSGGMVVISEDSCMVDIARYFTSFTREESCGKCISCRDGLDEAFKVLTKITSGLGEMSDLEKLRRLSSAIKNASECGLGKTAPNPILSTLKYFENEYLDHIINKKCEGVVCRDIISTSCRYNCPVHTDLPTFAALVADGKYEEAFEVIRENNPFPILTGYVCHHPCESRCAAAASGGEALAIQPLKQFVGDIMIESGKLAPQFKLDPPSLDKVAVVGAGPAGLSAAFDLRRMGYDVTVFERDSKAGGMVAQAIPRFRLPEKILDTEIKLIQDIGINIQLNSTIGEDKKPADLLAEGFKAVILATGTHAGTRLGIPGEDAEGVIDALDFLKEINKGGKPTLGKKVGIIGGGNAAIDAARSAWRLGPEEVAIIYRRTEAQMPAIESEIETAKEEGVKMQILTSPVEAIVDSGKLKALKCIKMELGMPDKSGRPRPTAIEGSGFEIELDNMIVAIGQKPEESSLPAADAQTLATDQEGIFACGDAVTGPTSVSECIAHGKKAAEVVNHFLRGTEAEPLKAPRKYDQEMPAIEISEEELESMKRCKAECMAVADRRNSFDRVEKTISEDAARAESRRCLRCDLEPEEEW